jgi:hypothetical protein
MSKSLDDLLNDFENIKNDDIIKITKDDLDKVDLNDIFEDKNTDEFADDINGKVLPYLEGNIIVPIKADKIEEACSTLNPDQLKAFEDMMYFLQNPDMEYYVLEGYAGTGKTYLMGKIIGCIDGSVAMSAPTNKAVKVLRMFGALGANVTYSTIHKLLALTVKYVKPPKGSTDEPKTKLVRNFRKMPTIGDYVVLIIDEVSMLDDELLIMIRDIKPRSLKVIFMGDPAQIPPVNRHDSIPLLKKERENWKMGHAELHKIMRQADGSKILEASYQIRNNRWNAGDVLLSRLSENDIIFYSANHKSDRDEFLNRMLITFDSEQFKDDANFCKFIGYTNKTVNFFNDLIRRHLNKTVLELPQLTIGEKLIVADHPIKDYATDIIKFNVSDELTVKEFEETTWKYVLPDKPNTRAIQSFDFVEDMEVKDVKGKTYIFKYYHTIVEYTAVTSEKLTSSIDILHKDSVNVLTWALSKLKGMEAWDEFFKLKERFASVDYNYAITAHKAQGSTYQHVFVAEDDIDTNRKNLERNRIKYTAITRAKQSLHILSQRNFPQEEQVRMLQNKTDKKSIFGKQEKLL